MLLTRHAETNDALVLGEIPEPSPGPGEVRVRLAAAALNRLDLFVRNGIPGVPIALPSVPGADGCGTIDAVGDGVASWKGGERVVLQPGLSCGRCEFCSRGEKSLCVEYRLLGEHLSGTFAEAIVVPAENVFPWPDGLSREKAAAFPLAGLTAWRMLMTRAALRKGESILIHGIGGGVATFALQNAKLAGASPIFVTSSDPKKLERARDLGADVLIDYRGVDVGKKVREATGKRGVDVVLDSVGEATWRSSLVAAAKGGRIVTCGATSGPNPEEEIRFIFWKQLSILGSTMGNDDEFRALLSAVGSLGIDPVVDAAYPLSEFRSAYERLESGERLGKIVLTVG
ncbi:MAG TPA: zinc-binding dehydrogenase [Thermoanaerobaculia bacterium]|nr:zinc-binding dehydrogenase [Thermoanaerobaculia bacterium]